MKSVFGPITSLRLGQALGIDTVPHKTCNFHCVYCQLGNEDPATEAIEEYIPRQEILAEVKQALSRHKPGELDWIAFVGSGEPTLHAGIGWLIRQVHAITPLPIAVITNGALLHLPHVRSELAVADAVVPTIAAGSPAAYQKIHCPLPGDSFERFAAGLAAFRRVYLGKLWAEVVLLGGVNDDTASLQEIAALLARFKPDEIHLSLPADNPAEPWVLPASEEGLMRATAILSKVAPVVHPVEGQFQLEQCEDVVDAVVGIITRHPMRQEELERALMRWAPGQVRAALNKLHANGRVHVIEKQGSRFWYATANSFPERADHALLLSQARPLRRRVAL